VEAYQHEPVFTLARDRVTLARDRVTLGRYENNVSACPTCFYLAQRKTTMKGSEKQTHALMGGLLLRGKQDAKQRLVEFCSFSNFPLAMHCANEKIEMNSKYI